MQLGDARTGKMGDNVSGFARALRRTGMPIDSSQMALATTALLLVGLDSKADVKHALEAVFVTRQEDREVFSQLFDAFFKNPELAQKLLSQMLPKAQGESKPNPNPRRSRVQEALHAVAKAGVQNQSEQEIELDAAMSASDTERLRNADFQSLSASEYQIIERLSKKIPLALPTMKSRRFMPNTRGHRLDWTRVLRETQRNAGELTVLPRLIRKPQLLPLMILIDISGSMQRYARLMLAFLHKSTKFAPRSVFALGTHLTDLRGAFKQTDTDDMLEQVNQLVDDFAGGTRLGESLNQLTKQYHRLFTGKRTIVLIITDGLDTGLKEELSSNLQWIKLHSKKILWLNPLLRYAGYEPLAQGASQLHGHADATLAIHNLSSLEQLSQSIAKLLKQ